MKYMVASDLHGSAYYTKQLLSRMEAENPDRLLLLGDLLYHGPRNEFPKGYETKEVFAMLNEVKDKILCVRGNCDSEVDQMVLEFPIMARHAILSADGVTVYATHGHIYHEHHMPDLPKGSVLLYGHYHIPFCREKDGIYCMNPGSVALPKDGSWHGYMTIEHGTFTWKDIDGNVRMTFPVPVRETRE